MARSGWKVCYLADAEVTHFGGGSSQRANDEMLVQLYQSKLRFFRKHYGPSRERPLRMLLIITLLAKEWSLATSSLLKKTNNQNKQSRKQRLMLARKLLRRQKTDSEP